MNKWHGRKRGCGQNCGQANIKFALNVDLLNKKLYTIVKIKKEDKKWKV